jgi:hypothetical protein
VIAEYGMPKMIISDNGSEFTSAGKADAERLYLELQRPPA